MSEQITGDVSGLPARLREAARAAKDAGLGDLDADQLDGLACVSCARTRSTRVPLVGFYGGRQLFLCLDRIACAAAAEQLPESLPRALEP
jgi:hypothetical protein